MAASKSEKVAFKDLGLAGMLGEIKKRSEDPDKDFVEDWAKAKDDYGSDIKAYEQMTKNDSCSVGAYGNKLAASVRLLCNSMPSYGFTLEDVLAFVRAYGFTPRSRPLSYNRQRLEYIIGPDCWCHAIWTTPFRPSSSSSSNPSV